MKKVFTISAAISIAAALVGCSASKNAASNLKPVETHKTGDIDIVLLSETGELQQGKNDFAVQFQDQQGQPVEVGAVQFGSSMAMPGMAPMSGESEIAPAGQTGAYRVKSNFAMSGAWRFTIEWNGPRGQGKTTFNTDVR
jgi:hypothetical protein